MEELRSEIRAAFDRQQEAHPPIGGLRTSVVAAVNARPRQAPNLQWLAVAVAAFLTIAIVVVLLATQSPPRPVPVKDYGPPPAGVSLLYVRDPNNPSWLIGYDWSGTPRGTVKLSADVVRYSSTVKMAPDGSGFEVGATYKGATAIFLDRLGNLVASETGPADVVGAMWADDYQHQCVMTISSTYVWRLATQLPGEALRPVAVIARDPGVGQSGISIAACSFKSDVAIAVRTTIAWPAELWVIRLSDGRILSHHFYGSNVLTSIIASSDGKYIAENLNGSQVGARIVRVSDWTVVYTLDFVAEVWAFSGDDSRLLISKTPANPLLASDLEILDWPLGCPSTGSCHVSLLWAYTGPDTLGSFTAEPGGRDFALAFKRHDQIKQTCSSGGAIPVTSGSRVDPTCEITEDPLTDVVIVQGDMTTTKIAGRFMTVW